jgi:hypothetical protein
VAYRNVLLFIYLTVIATSAWQSLMNKAMHSMKLVGELMGAERRSLVGSGPWTIEGNGFY